MKVVWVPSDGWAEKNNLDDREHEQEQDDAVEKAGKCIGKCYLKKYFRGFWGAVIPDNGIPNNSIQYEFTSICLPNLSELMLQRFGTVPICIGTAETPK